MDQYEYMEIPLSLFPQHIIDQYDPQSKVRNGHIYHEIRRSIYGLPQDGYLANAQLQKSLAPSGH